MHVATLQSQETPSSIPELYEYSKVKQNTTYPDFTQTLNFLDNEEVESLKTKPEKLLRQITQIPSDLTYGKWDNEYFYRHTKSVKGIVDIHKDRVIRVSDSKTDEKLYLVIVNPVLNVAWCQQVIT